MIVTNVQDVVVYRNKLKIIKENGIIPSDRSLGFRDPRGLSRDDEAPPRALYKAALLSEVAVVS